MAHAMQVHDPRGFPPQVKGHPLAARVQALDGRTLYLVDCLFDNSEAFMDQLKAWFAEHMPAVETRPITPKESWVEDPEMCARIIRDGDAAILGVGLWSTCSPTVVGLAIELEKGGVPTVAVHTHVFSRLARSVARVNGMPGARQAFVPQPVVGKSPSELRAYIEGEDPVSGRVFMQELLEGLTEPLTAEDTKGLSFDRSRPRLLEPGTEDELHQRFLDERWTDMLPVVLPTEERVEAMLKATSRSPDEIVGRMRPTMFREYWEYSVEKVAVNAVMAGARPEYLPVILALASTGQTARSSSTTSFATIAMVNGPVRHEIDMNSGTGAFGPYNHANATIGRAFGLLSQNLQGGSVPGETYMGSQGNSYSYSACFAENEERSPWAPFHTAHGFDAEQSAVSAFMGGWFTEYGTIRDDTWADRFRIQLRAIDPFTGPLLALDPLGANKLVEYGFDTREKLAEWLAENSLRTAREFWDNQWMQTLIRPRALLGQEPFASYLDAEPDEMIQTFQPEDIHPVVVGGETGGTYKMIGGMLRGNIASVDDWR